jgi:hypothetical protein
MIDFSTSTAAFRGLFGPKRFFRAQRADFAHQLIKARLARKRLVNPISENTCAAFFAIPL